MKNFITSKRFLMTLTITAVVVVLGFMTVRRIKTGQFLELCINGTGEEVMEAIRNGADVFAEDPNGWTALMWAVGNNTNTDVMLVLAGAGLDVNARSKNGWTPLIYAAQYNPNPEMIRELVAAGADINVTDFNGWTPLMFAAWRNRNPEVINMLLELGADKTATDRAGMTAFDYAQKNPFLKNFKVLRTKGSGRTGNSVR